MKYLVTENENSQQNNSINKLLENSGLERYLSKCGNRTLIYFKLGWKWKRSQVAKPVLERTHKAGFITQLISKFVANFNKTMSQQHEERHEMEETEKAVRK